MKNQNLFQVLSIALLLMAISFFLSCSPGDKRSGEIYPDETRISVTLVSGPAAALSGPEPNLYSELKLAAVPLAGYQLYCATVDEPVVEDIGVADENGNVTVVLKIKGHNIACSILEPAGTTIATLVFLDASGANQSRVISGSGEINLGLITIDLSTGIAQAIIPANASIVASNNPKTKIDSAPANPATSQTATFEFSCDQPICTFTCKLDSGAWEACASPKSYAGLSYGPHTFRVKAKNAEGFPDPTHAAYVWTIIAVPPETTITSGPPNPSASQDAAFQFICDQANCAFECNLDSGGWSTCTSPVTLTGLSDASHTFMVRASDGLGNVDQSPAAYFWVIDTIAPGTNITAKPPSYSDSADAGFEFICSDPVCGFECRLDSGPWSICGSPVQYSGLSEGDHIFIVRAQDTLGNWDPTPASYYWNITLPPDTFMTSQPEDPTNSHDAIFEFGCSDPSCTFECRLDSEPWATCTSPKTYISAEYWTATSIVNAPSARRNHTAVWTGTEMIIWGGFNGSTTYNTGGRYNPATDSWLPTSTGLNVPIDRYNHTAVWTGNEMIVWGGYCLSGSDTFRNDGGKYYPTTDSWITTNIDNAPQARWHHTSIWTGTEMIVWAGLGLNSYLITGGRYDPEDDSWTETSTINAPSKRTGQIAFWTGTEMIVWGGSSNGYSLNTGGRYNPSSDSWTATSLTNAPVPRHSTPAVWTGTEMIVWGGFYDHAVNSYDLYLDSGARYDPANDSWTATSAINAPTARKEHTAIWTGKEMVIWGGYSGPYTPLNDGARYNPSTDSWIPTSMDSNVPTARYIYSAVWTGKEMIVWGGMTWIGTHWFNLDTGGIYSLFALSKGDHNFQVRALDQGGMVDPTPASYTWTINP